MTEIWPVVVSLVQCIARRRTIEVFEASEEEGVARSISVPKTILTLLNQENRQMSLDLRYVSHGHKHR